MPPVPPESSGPSSRPHHRHPGDGWVECGDHRHWGLHGAAGLFLVRRATTGRATHVVLQHRAAWSHHGGTWGIPGGAITPDETPAEGALREASEEAGIDPAAVQVLGEHVHDHGVWRYTTVLAEPAGSDGTDGATAMEVRATDPESIEVRWVAVDDIAALELHPTFATALPRLLDLVAVASHA